jgi:GxxExxY protein
MIKYRNLTGQIIKAFYEVYNELGTGFLESVYENALVLVLREYGLHVEQQVPITVYFRDTEVGFFRADLMVEEKVIVELKAVCGLIPDHEAQTLNYLKAKEIDIGLLMNFGDEPAFKRFIFDQKRRPINGR